MPEEPALISQLVVILKDTARGYIISFTELLRSGTTLSTVYGNLIPTLIVVAALFVALDYTLTMVARVVERRLKRAQRTAGPAAGGAGPAGPGWPPVPAGVEGPPLR